MSRQRYAGALVAAAVMFTALLLGYEVAIQTLFGPELLDTELKVNAGRFIAAFIGALGGAAAVLIPGRRER